MSDDFVPADFVAPHGFTGTGYRLEPLGPEHNERDHRAWMSSIEHIHSTPGFPHGDWPSPMSLEANLADLERHSRDFVERKGFTYTILVGDDVIGCLYIYPGETDEAPVQVRSWVTEPHATLDIVVWREVSRWIRDEWPFEQVSYAVRT